MTFQTTPATNWPSDENKIWLNPYMFLHNWSTSIEVRSRWLTDVSANRNSGEVRVGLVDRPFRVLTARYTGMTKEQVLGHQMMLGRMGKARFWFPLYSDVTYLTSNVSQPSQTTTTTLEPFVLPCDTTNRRFYSSKYVAIVTVDTESKSKTPYVDIVRIVSVNDDYLSVSGTLSRNYNLGSKVFPITVCKILAQESKDSITDRVSDGNITVNEIIGKYSLPASAINKEITTDYSEAVAPIGEEYPILSIRPDWREGSIGWERDLQINSSGRGEIIETYGNRPLVNKSTSFTFLNRSSAFNFLKLFDSRRGRLHPLFVISDFNEYSEIYDISSDRKQISIEYTGPKINWAFRPYLAIRLKDGTHIIRKVCDVLSTSTTTYEPLTTTADPGATLESVCLETALPAFSLSNVHRLHTGYLVRFNKDELVESWITDSIMQCSIDFKELDEKDIDYEVGYFGTTTTTLEPTTTAGPTTTLAGDPGSVTAFFPAEGEAYLQDLYLTDAEGTWDGHVLNMTTGNAAGYYATIVYWGGPGYPWFQLVQYSFPYPPAPETWDVQVGDHYVLF